MPEYLSPGVYVEEVDAGPKPIEGVSTSTAGFLGETEKGPMTPQLVTSMERFKSIYGGPIPGKYLSHAVDGFFRNGGQRLYIGRIRPGAESAKLTLNSATPVKDVISLQAEYLVEYGENIYVRIRSHTDPKLFSISFYYWKSLPPNVNKNGTTPYYVVDPEDSRNSSNANLRAPDLTETIDNLSIDENSSNYFETRINSISKLVRVKKIDNSVKPDVCGIESVPDLNKDDSGGNLPGNALVLSLEKGAPSKLVKNDIEGINNAPGFRYGLLAFTEIDEISIVAIPDENEYVDENDMCSNFPTKCLIDHCENLKDRFAICSIPSNKSEVDKIEWPADSKYAAVYYPWINIPDPAAARTIKVPPTGHIAGIYARSDTERGVHKAPANEVVRGATGLEYTITKGEHDILNPKGINVIRAFPGRGIRVWGARTMSSDSSWKYINVRRLFNYVEESIDEGTQWVVFEPNDEKLWARVRQSISNFLTTVWSSGALMGSKASQAFFVKCDYTTMTQGDIDNGRLICIVGIAPVKPAEFVIFRIQQKTLESTSAN